MVGAVAVAERLRAAALGASRVSQAPPRSYAVIVIVNPAPPSSLLGYFYSRPRYVAST